MREPSEAAKARVMEYVDDLRMAGPSREWIDWDVVTPRAFALFVDRVSSAVSTLKAVAHKGVIRSMEADECLSQFVLPETVDPLFRMMRLIDPDFYKTNADWLREQLAKRGLAVVEITPIPTFGPNDTITFPDCKQ